MEIEVTTVIAAILQVCRNDRRRFAPSEVRKMIQRMNPSAAAMEPALIAAKMQPHLKLLARCECIQAIPTAQVRNRPRLISNRERLQQLLDAPSRVHEFYVDRIEAELDGPEATIGLSLDQVSDPEPHARLIHQARDEVLEALDEHENDLQNMTSEMGQRLMNRLDGIESCIAALTRLLSESHAGTDAKISAIASVFAPEVLKRPAAAVVTGRIGHMLD